MTMDKRNDEGHRPWADHKGELPTLHINEAVENLYVSLDAWGPSTNIYAHLYNQIQSNWGESPSKVERDEDLTPGQLAYVEKCIAGKTLVNALESISTMWTLDGVSRAFTHQIVRTRVGASFMQHGGRDNDWRHRDWRMPETIVRADAHLNGYLNTIKDCKHCLTDEKPLRRYLAERASDVSGLYGAIYSYIMEGKKLYAALVDSGIPWQDARRVLHIGSETYIHCNYNFLALKGVLANRLEFVNDWEINAVSQLMVREVKMKMPKLFGMYLLSHSDQQGRAAFAGLDSWPPDQKYPAAWDQADRKHRPEQMPFFVLTDEAMKGGPVEWIATNGTYPDRERGEGLNA